MSPQAYPYLNQSRTNGGRETTAHQRALIPAPTCHAVSLIDHHGPASAQKAASPVTCWRRSPSPAAGASCKSPVLAIRVVSRERRALSKIGGRHVPAAPGRLDKPERSTHMSEHLRQQFHELGRGLEDLENSMDTSEGWLRDVESLWPERDCEHLKEKQADLHRRLLPLRRHAGSARSPLHMNAARTPSGRFVGESRAMRERLGGMTCRQVSFD